MDPIAALRRLVLAEGPPGKEDGVRAVFAELAGELGVEGRTDAKGNWLVGPEEARIVVTAHLDEIALVVRAMERDGTIRVGPLGGIHPWKIGETPVRMLSREPVDAVLGYGGIHTEDPAAVVVQVRDSAPSWRQARVLTGLSADDLIARGVRPGVRVVLGPSRRTLLELGGGLVAAPFLDDRADLLAMLLHWADGGPRPGVLYAATAAEEVGGEGAQWILGRLRPEICIALELAPIVPDAPLSLGPSPAVWVTDGYAAMSVADGELLADLEPGIGWQALSRGGSDASCAAASGLIARPITLGLPMANSHGLEVMHREAPARLADLLGRLLAKLR